MFLVAALLLRNQHQAVVADLHLLHFVEELAVGPRHLVHLVKIDQSGIPQDTFEKHLELGYGGQPNALKLIELIQLVSDS
jgi:hypothetical protein